MLAGNRLLAHDDEWGVVVEIGYRDGSVVKAFSLRAGRDPVADDFEGIAAAEGHIYLVTSFGTVCTNSSRAPTGQPFPTICMQPALDGITK